MESFIKAFILTSFIGFIISLLIPKKNEKIVSFVSYGTIGLQLIGTIFFLGYWIYNGLPEINMKEFSIFQAKGYDFYIDLFFDKISATYLIIGVLLTFLITVYSRYYLHKEPGYKRFFSILLFFYLGYNIIIFSGNLETLFIGWEILGISSFLLIAFYRDRYLPVKNAVKVFSIYRIGDVGLILAMWLSHHLWHQNISFHDLENAVQVNEHIANHSFMGIFIALLIYMSAAAKSAQLPFSSWLPRAMEGPTPSSAIFYGSLSIHIGAFIMLRTFHFWEFQTSFRIFVVIIGLLTSVMALLTARVQSTVKSQVAYSSIAQIGLIFIEIALGLESLALVHIAGNAFLRMYQLLVSPSIVSYKIREQFYNFIPRHKTIEDGFPKKLEYTLYILSLKEWNLDSLMYTILWNPLKKIGKRLNFLSFKNVYFFFTMIFIIGILFIYFKDRLPSKILHLLPTIFSFIGLLAIIKGFTERSSVRLSWSLILINHFTTVLAISFNENFDTSHIWWYISGVIISGIIGYACIQRLRNLESWISLDKFYGHSYEHPKIAFLFLLACLGISGFPISPTFIGEDLIFSHINENQFFLAFFIALSFVLNGLTVIRIYARIFLGPNLKKFQGNTQRAA